jgi:protein-tyrosine-phosphatase
VRRRAALDALGRRGVPRSVLVVCHGNICRSPYAAAALHAALGDGGVRVSSAGFLAEGRPAPPQAVTVAARLGVDLRSHRSATLTGTVVALAELIVVMDSDQRREIARRFGRRPTDVLILGDLDPEPIDTRTIHDPVDQSEGVFADSYARIDRCVARLAGAITRRRSRAMRAP